MNKISRIFILTVAFFLTMIPAQATMTTITDNAYPDNFPEIDEGNIVWDGNGDIYLYNMESGITKKLADDGQFPHIRNNIVVWSGSDNLGVDTEIFMYNITSGEKKQISNNNYNDWAAQTDGKNVVWYDEEVWPNSEIYLYNIESGLTTRITNNDHEDKVPQIGSGYVVWHGDDDYEIFMYNIGTGVTTQITNNNYLDEYPKIDNGNIVWEGDNQIYLYNITSEKTTQLTNTPYINTDQQINGENIVWGGSDANDFEIYQYNIGTGITTQITNNKVIDMEPQIDGENVVWTGEIGKGKDKDFDIFLYNIGTGETIDIERPLEDINPQIDNGNIVWAGYDGSDYEIILQTYPCHCVELDVQPDTAKAKGSYTNITANVVLNNTPDPGGVQRSADIEIDIDWIINMLCAGEKGTCSATITPTITSDLKIGNKDTTQTSQSNTPTSITCNGKCDTIVHTTSNSGNGHTKSMITVHRDSGGQINDKSISGTITVTMNSDCPIKKKTTTLHISGTVTGSKSSASVSGVHTK